MTDRILSLMGICRRAGKLIIGAQSVIDSANAQNARLIIFANDFSQNSAKAVIQSADANNVRVITINRSKDEISPAVGRLCGVCATEDEGFAKKLIALNENDREEN